MKLVTAATMQSLDRYTIEDVGIPGVVLMEAAGRACAEHAAELMVQRCLNDAVVLCGPGNNGGDGYVAARHLADAGFSVTVALLASPGSVKGDARVYLDALSSFPVDVVEIVDDEAIAGMVEAASEGMVIDAVFGTGLVRPVEGRYARVIETCCRAAAGTLAVDIPSGVCSDTGRILGTAFRADVTVTFGTAKIGHFSYPGRDFCGIVEVEDIGIPSAALDDAEGALLLSPHEASASLAPRAAPSFKNSFGHLLVLGGLKGKAGAALLAAMAAVRSGAGLVTVATDIDAQAHLEGRFPEVMIEGPVRVDSGVVVLDAAAMDELDEGKTAVAVGPGLSTMPGAEELVRHALDLGVPVVVDADGLNVIAGEGADAFELSGACVLTPHPGEAARLLGVRTAEIQADRVGAARKLVDATGAVVVLKGAGTVVSAPGGRLAINPTGGPGLATAGTGDVLTGMIGALMAQGADSWTAACGAVFIHGLAGDLAEERLGPHSTSAYDVVESIPEAIGEVTGQS